jgi:hypothetical protein
MKCVILKNTTVIETLYIKVITKLIENLRNS